MFCFFFSSRRRHTRCLSDWSSDVCSSDLAHRRRGVLLERLRRGHRRRAAPHLRAADPPSALGLPPRRALPPPRSEERRVGKEYRTRWSRYSQKDKRRHICAKNESSTSEGN